ncbi:hypothetical protein F4679DRAFT_577098 [Xylaria curta]|nr:hypothetical protein F4679DRAFT_577098 [Xylaria curta]
MVMLQLANHQFFLAQLTTFYLHSLCSEAFTHNKLDIHHKRAKAWLKHWPERYKDHDSHVNPLDNSQSSKEEDYCTQACLLGLKQGGYLDKNCFNKQLRQTLFRYCIALNHYGFAKKNGAIRRLFKVELTPYGYIFVGKGILYQFYLDRLQHESQVYLRLERLQGWVIPVHLGIVNLAELWGYSLPGGYQVLHLLLMSWAGERALVSTPGYAEGLEDLEEKLWNEEVSHEDVRGPNVLWNQERNSLMLIDFDQAIFRQPAQHKQVTKLIKTGTKRGSPENDILEKSAKRARTGNTPRVLRQAQS